MSDVQIPLAVFGGTHIGLVHHKNEDSFSISPTADGGMLLLVCDGMGGMGKGDEASALALKLLNAELLPGSGYPPDRMKRAIAITDLMVREALCNSGEGLPGSTAVMVYVHKGLGHVAWVGDSRAYLVRNGELVERTRDHKLVEELMRAGELTEEEAKTSTLAHVVTRALGGRSAREPPIPASVLPTPWALKTGDIVIVCSDGVCDLVEDAELADFVSDKTPEECVNTLIELVLERGAHDNTTVIAATWEGPDTEDVCEDTKETPMFAPMRNGSPDDEDTDPGGTTWDDLAVKRPDPDPEDDTEVTLVPPPELEELVKKVLTANPSTSEAEPPGTSDEEGSAAVWKVLLTVSLAASLVLGAVCAAKMLLSGASG